MKGFAAILRASSVFAISIEPSHAIVSSFISMSAPRSPAWVAIHRYRLSSFDIGEWAISALRLRRDRMQ